MSNFVKNYRVYLFILFYSLLIFIIAVVCVFFKLNVQMLENGKFDLIIANVDLSCH